MNKKMKFRMDIKGVTSEGTFEGLLSPYDIVDQGGDVIEKGAYTKTLKDHGNTRPMLWQHKTDEPIGLLTLDDRPDGLWCKGQILLDIPMGKTAYAVIKAGIVKGLSIGFESIKDNMHKGIRHLKEIKLYEGSIVTFPMATDAMITAVKAKLAETKDDFNEELAERQLMDAGYQMRSALCGALDSLLYSGLTKDDAVAGAETIIQQFSDAYLAYLPSYIDMLAEYYGSEMETWSREQIETKAGAAISSANKRTIQSIIDTLSALIAEKAAASTSTAEAAEPEIKHEPVEVDHSAFKPLLSEIISLINN